MITRKTPPAAPPRGPVKKTPAATIPPVDPHNRPLVPPCRNDEKTGCKYCSLMPFHKDFAAKSEGYMRDAEKLVAKLKEPHTIRCHNVSEPWTEVDVLFIGEAPGADEDRMGAPFVGRSGTALRNTIADVESLSPRKIGFANVIRCRPPLNRDPNKTEVKSCSPELIREILARKPKLLVATGNHALELLTGQTGITTLAGKFLKATHPELVGMTVLGCLHPAYVLRMDHMLEAFRDTIELAGTFLDGKHVELPGKGEYFIIDDLERLKRLLGDFAANAKRLGKEKYKVAFDTETGSLTPFQSKFPRLLCFSFSDAAGTGYTVPFDHAESPWSFGGSKFHERPHVVKYLQQFFLNPDIKRIAQNEKFDRQHVRGALDIELLITDGDTMAKHLTIDERRGTHGLKTLAYFATGMGGYERELELYIERNKAADPDKGGSYANIPLDLLALYGAMDADVTYRVDDWITAQDDYAQSEKFRNLAEHYFPKLSAVLAKMEYAGAQINPDIVGILDAKYSKDMRVAQEKVAGFPTIKRFVANQRLAKDDPEFEFNPGSKKQLEVVLFEMCALTPTELTDNGFAVMTARYKRLNDEAKEKKLPRVDFTAIIKAALANKEWGLFTVDAEALHEFERQKGEGGDISTAILEYRAAQVLHSTFVIPLTTMLDEAGRIHGNFNIMGTVTGRLSSNNPNLQNIPNKGGGLIKQAYVSRFGAYGVLLNVDFSQIELRIAAAWFNEPKMKEVYRKKQDLHRLTAAIIAGLSLEAFKKLPSEKQKEWRTRAKRVNFGVLYGGGAGVLQATLKKDGVFVSLEECQEFIDKFFKAYPSLKKGMDNLERSVQEKGYLESFTGRRRRVPEVFSNDRELVSRALRQSINFPIQSSAGDMTLMALVLIDRILTKEGFKSVPILTVHDSIVFDCHVDEVIEVARIAKEVMENLPSLSDEVLPGITWEWLDVPIVAECEAGCNWGAMVEFEPDDMIQGKTDEAELIGKNEKGKIDILRKPVNVDELWECFAFKTSKGVSAA